MSLFHSKRVAVQHVYYKPSAMSRLKAAVTGRPQPRPRAAAPAPRRMHQGGRTVVRQPVRKTGFFHRSPRRTVVTSQRKPGFLSSLRPRQRAPRGAGVAGGRHRHHGHDKHKKEKKHSHKGRNMLAILALLGLKKQHDHKKHQKQSHHRHL